jgi:hypothetical protein
MDIENGDLSNRLIDSHSEDPYQRPYFFFREKKYAGEWRVYYTSIPIWRLLNSVILIYSMVVGIGFIASLCTDGAVFICSCSMVAALLYWIWATWWDEAYAMPLTWSYLKHQGFNPCWIMLWLIYQAMVRLIPQHSYSMFILYSCYLALLDFSFSCLYDSNRLHIHL